MAFSILFLFRLLAPHVFSVFSLMVPASSFVSLFFVYAANFTRAFLFPAFLIVHVPSARPLPPLPVASLTGRIFFFLAPGSADPWQSGASLPASFWALPPPRASARGGGLGATGLAGPGV